MIERTLLTLDELKSLPKGDFIVMKTGVHPMRVHLKLFFKWGIEFDDEHPYTVSDMGNREVKYADKKKLQDGNLEKYPPERKEEKPAPSSSDSAVRHSRTAAQSRCGIYLSRRQDERKQQVLACHTDHSR